MCIRDRAAGALVSEGKELPDGSLVMGMPARVKRTLSDEEIAHLCTCLLYTSPWQ